MKYIGTLVIFVLTSAPVLAYEYKASTVATTWRLKTYAGTIHDFHYRFPPDHQANTTNVTLYSDAGGAYDLDPPEYYFSPFTKNPTLQTSDDNWGRGKLEIQLGDKYAMNYDFTNHVTTGSTTDWGKADETGDLKYRHVPAYPGVQSVYRFSCSHPETITDRYATNWIEWGYVMELYAKRKGSANAGISLFVECNIRYERQYDLNLSILNTTMAISSKSGTAQSYSNKLIISGDGGGADIIINNPHIRDIVVSFSTSGTSTTTVVDLNNNTTQTKDFFVKPVNTSPGERTYNVTFTAAYR